MRELSQPNPRHQAGSKAGRGAALALAMLTAAWPAAQIARAEPVAGSSFVTVSGGRDLVRQVAVFGPDNRVSLPSDKAALSNSIGLLYDTRTQSVCTAFCVADSMIATAGHCLFRTAGERPPKLSGFLFRLQPRTGAAANSRIAGSATNSEAQHIASGSQKLRVSPPIDAASDWAVVRLASPVCRGHALNVSRQREDELIRLSAAQRVYHVAYHRDFGNWELALGAPCAIRRSFNGADWRTISRDFVDANHVILHTCDTGGASSGSPMLIDGPSGPEVIGINVGTYLQSRVLTQQGEVIHRYRSETVANRAVASGAFRDAMDALHRADILASRKDIVAVQTLLGLAGYDTGPKDGIYGARLSAAIRAFERSEARKETGLATIELLRRLNSLDAERRGTTPRVPRPPHVETGSAGSHTLSNGKATVSGDKATLPR